MEFNEFEKDLINQVSLSVEKDRSGKAIDWSYWAKHKAIKPKEAALLAYHVCPNMVCSALRIEDNHIYPYQEIKELKSLLASHEKQWTLAELLRFLREYGYFVPFGMEQVVFNGKLELVDGVGTDKTRKKLKPLERETNEGLLLIYEIFNYYKVEYLDELPAHKAWGKIISKEFNSDSLSSIAGSNKSITLSGGEKISKTDFGDKYRRRFE